MIHRSQQGFTLIEILVALIISGLGLAASMGLMSSGLHLSGTSSRVLRETSLARSALERFGVDLKIVQGQMTGEMSAGLRWRSEIQPLETGAPTDMFRAAIVTVTVWDGSENDPGVRLTTLRLMPPAAPGGVVQ